MFNDFDDEELMEEKIINDCKPYLKLLKHLNNNKIHSVLYTGSANIYEELTKKQIKVREHPKNMDDMTNNILNKWFQDKFNFPVRDKCLYCTTNIGQAKDYGFLHYVFPIGKFNIYNSSNVSDLYIYLNNRLLLNSLAPKLNKEQEKVLNSKGTFKEIVDSIKKEYPELYEETVFQIMDNSNYEKNNFVNAFLNKNEIMLTCKSYYIVEANERYREFFKDFIWKN